MSSLVAPKNSSLVIDVLSHLASRSGKLSSASGSSLTFTDEKGNSVKGVNQVVKGLVELVEPTNLLFGATEECKCNVLQWLDLIYKKNPAEICEFGQLVSQIEKTLCSQPYLSSSELTLSDICAISYLEKSRHYSKYRGSESFTRWLDLCVNSPLLKGKTTLLVTSKESVCSFEEGGNFLDLPNAELNKVVVRFPPEASGYLHIGHAKAALLNQYYKDKYKGKLILRFDDTNPTKEKQHFEDIILHDIKLLGLTPDLFTRTSDYFDLLLNYAEIMIKKGLAYCDDTPIDSMRDERTRKIASCNRDTSVDLNLQRWAGMKTEDPMYQSFCLRAKIDYQSQNGCMRDPTMYRICLDEHVAHGFKYRVYPTYDFACPIVDSIEGVTHALRTSEYHDRNEQYYWFLNALELRTPILHDFSRLCMQYSLLSKRKLTKLIELGLVDGWDDPRMPTVRGLLRRGLTVTGLREFILSIGFSRTGVNMQPDKLWAFNKKVVEPTAARYTVLNSADKVVVNIRGSIEETSRECYLVPKDPSHGSKTIYYSQIIYIDAEDAAQLKTGATITLVNWGNFKVANINTVKDKNVIMSIDIDPDLDNKCYSNTGKFTWLGTGKSDSEHPVPVILKYYDHLFTKPNITSDDCDQFINPCSLKIVQAIGEPCLRDLKKGTIIQIMRKGLFVCDQEMSQGPESSPCVLIEVPSGSNQKAPISSGPKLAADQKISLEPSQGVKQKNTSSKSQQEKPSNAANSSKQSGSVQLKKGPQKKTKLGLTVTKAGDFSEWYTQVLVKSEMLDYYDVSGCYVLRPQSYFVWECIQNFFNREIKKMGIENCYFPTFVTKAALNKEKTHIADFAPEVAWVTKSGDTDLIEPIAIRPTSETVIYPSVARWVQSHRDLPVRLNQWCNVVRWEFKHPTPFLRTREFLWQEGHTAFATKQEADTEVLQILELYSRVYTELLAIPVVKGHKSEAEKFPGADYTTTVEAYLPVTGKGCQAATSHHLGQNFSKMFGISFEDPITQEKCFAYQNSWGISTRAIGVMVMIHSDDKGLVMPPAVASLQAVIIPCGISASIHEDDKNALFTACDKVQQALDSKSIRSTVDKRDHVTTGWKFNCWELKGVPIRIEIGPSDLENGVAVLVRRDTGEKIKSQMDTIAESVSQLLSQMHSDMLNKAKKHFDEGTKTCENWDDFIHHIDDKKVILAPFCGSASCEALIKQNSTSHIEEDDGKGGKQVVTLMGAKTLCIPLSQEKEITSQTRCIRPHCENKAQFYAMFGRSY